MTGRLGGRPPVKGQRTILWIAAGLACLAVGYGLLSVLVHLFSLNVRVFEGSWEDREGGYSATLPIVSEPEICLCPAYECETGFEAATLAWRSPFGWREFVYFRDPAQGPDRDRRPIRPVYRVEYCVTKRAGDALRILLTPDDRILSLKIE